MRKRLFVLRHAKSDWSEVGQLDLDRPLNERGRQAAALMGRYVAGEGLTFDRVVASPARRVEETLAILFAAAGQTVEVVREPLAYLATEASLRALVAKHGGEARSLLLAGHHPGLQQLALGVSRASDRHRRALETKLPTGALAELELEDWETREGRLVRFVRPRDLEAG